MSGNESDKNRPANGPDHEETSGSDLTIADAPSSASNESTLAENEIIDGISDVRVSGTAGARRKDEYDVDFEDTREFAVFRWGDILRAAADRLSASDHKIVTKYNDWGDIREEVHGKLMDTSSTPAMKRHLGRIQPLPRTLSTLTRKFASLVAPQEPRFDLIWGMIYLNLKLSYTSPDRLKRTADLLNKIRSVVALFNQCLASCDQVNEMLLNIVDFLDPLTVILVDSITYLHRYDSDTAAEQAWPDLRENINRNLAELDGIVKHVNDVTSYSRVNQDRQFRNMSLRYALVPENEEPGVFPNIILPFRQNPRFYGRAVELEKIEKYLSPKDDQSLRTYTIYGRRGVGKTEIALQFAYMNQPGFDAIFWIQCETSVAIRQSFTNVAVALNLPAADRDGHHEENQLAVQNWLKKTSKRWLLIFDNAERDQILRGYWPMGSSGAILTTSRKYYNFSKDLQRRGETIKPFDSAQSWDLLLQLLGDDWKKMEREGLIPPSEVLAAKNMLERLGGLALAIQQAAILIKNPEIGGPTISKTYEMFKEKIRTLPERHVSDRSNTELPLDALWDMTFNSLTKNARALLGVLAWLSPDGIQIQLFLPRNQPALDGPLAFCKLDPTYVDGKDRAPLFSVVTPLPAFEKAIDELLAKKLIRRDRNVLSIHRVVQEAVNYHDVEDLQKSFDVASRLVYEQFPKQLMGESLNKQWNVCQEYIPHGVYLSKKYSEYAPGKLKAHEFFVKLLTNCAWYLYEIGDYEVSGRVVETGIAACEDKTSMLYAQLVNTAGSRFFDLNRLSECRGAWETVLRIRRERLPHDNPFIAAVYSNLGNLETASGNLAESSDYFERATLIWVAGGDATAYHLALTYLCTGRMHMLQGNFREAEKYTTLSESIFTRIGAPSLAMAHVHLAYGNSEFLERRWAIAQRSYGECLRIALGDLPTHPITAAAYYSLACVEFAQDHAEVAKGHLNKARQIAELRSPARDDGVIARILWKTAVVLESDVLGKFSSEADALRQRAEVARKQLMVSGEGGSIPFVDEDDTERDQEEDSYDALVPLFYR